MIREIDAFLISQVERAASWVQLWTGLDCLDQARISAGLAGCCLLWDIASKARWTGRHDWWGYLILIGLTARAVFEHEGIQIIRHEAKMGLRNRNKLRPFGTATRLFLVCVCGVDILAFIFQPAKRYWAVSGYIWFYSAYVFLEACDPLPPSLGKVREWLQALGNRLVPQGASE